MQKLTQLEAKAAGNALIEWFNSQEIGPDDAFIIMQKVVAKIVVDRDPNNARNTWHAELQVNHIATVNAVNTYNLAKQQARRG